MSVGGHWTRGGPSNASASPKMTVVFLSNVVGQLWTIRRAPQCGHTSGQSQVFGHFISVPHVLQKPMSGGPLRSLTPRTP